LENERTYLTEWALADLAKFVRKLRPSDEVAVEIASNTRLFHEAVASHVARVVVVDSNQFRVISRSVKKTDANDARLLALYLSKGLLPEVRMKNRQQARVASLTQTRDTLVKAAQRAQEQGQQYSVGAGTKSSERGAVEREAVS